MLGKMGELPDIIEAALSHGSIRSPLAATYDRSRYRPQVAAALQRLAMRWTGSRRGRRRWCRCALGPDVSIDLSPPVPPPFTLDSQRLGNLPQVTAKTDYTGRRKIRTNCRVALPISRFSGLVC